MLSFILKYKYLSCNHACCILYLFASCYIYGKWPSVIIDTLLLDLFNIKTGLYFVWLFFLCCIVVIAVVDIKT